MGSRDRRLPYTSIFNAALGIGLSRADVMEMPWGQLVLTLQAKSMEYSDGPTVRQATQKEIDDWF